MQHGPAEQHTTQLGILSQRSTCRQPCVSAAGAGSAAPLLPAERRRATIRKRRTSLNAQLLANVEQGVTGLHRVLGAEAIFCEATGHGRGGREGCGPTGRTVVGGGAGRRLGPACRWRRVAPAAIFSVGMACTATARQSAARRARGTMAARTVGVGGACKAWGARGGLKLYVCFWEAVRRGRRRQASPVGKQML